MHLQGDLQVVFDALYNMGIIEPILQKDWATDLTEMRHDRGRLEQIILVVNSCIGDSRQLMYQLEKFDKQSLDCLAMEVARELANFHAREKLH
jgi:hypothetical protein